MYDVFATEDVDLEEELDDSVLLMEAGVCHRMASPIEVFVEGQSLGSTDWVFRYEDVGGAYGLAHTGPNASPSSQCGEDLDTTTNLIRPNDVLPSGKTLSDFRLSGGGSGTINAVISYQHTESGRDASRCFFDCWDDDTPYTDAFVWGVR